MDTGTTITVSVACMSLSVAIAAIAFASGPPICAETSPALVRHCLIGPFNEETKACLKHAELFHGLCVEGPP